MTGLQLGGSWAGGWDEPGLLSVLLIATSLAGSGIFVYDPSPGAGNLIGSETAVSGDDLYGNLALPGKVTYFFKPTAPPGYYAIQQFGASFNFYSAATEAGPWTQLAALALTMTSSTLHPPPAGLLQVTGTGFSLNGTEVTYFPSGDTTGATDGPVMNNLLAAGASIRLVPGVYYTNTGINPTANTSVKGPNRDICTIRQTDSTHTGFSWTSQNGVTLEGFTLVGTGSGTSAGIDATGSPLDYTTIRNVKIQSWGGSGVNLSGNIVSRFEGVVSLLNGGNGFSLFSAPTSTVFDNCYANANTLAGYRLANCHYVVLDGCACDNNKQGGFILSQCVACVVNGANVQSNTGTTEQFLMTGGTCNVVNGLFCDNTTVTQSVHLSSTETFATLTGLIEVSPGAGPTAFITTDAGTSCVVINDKHTTANSFAAGTAYEILPTSAVFH